MKAPPVEVASSAQSAPPKLHSLQPGEQVHMSEQATEITRWTPKKRFQS